MINSNFSGRTLGEPTTTVNFPEPFDFVHTYIVLQHIPVELGYSIIERLISITKHGGYGMIHFTYANHMSAYTNKIYALKARYKWFHGFTNLLKGAHPNAPLMQMNNYSLPRVFEIFKKHAIRQCCIDFTDHGGFLGLCVYFQK